MVRGLQLVTGDDNPDFMEELKDVDAYPDAVTTGRLIFETLNPRTAEFDIEAFHASWGEVEMRRDPHTIFPPVPSDALVNLWVGREGKKATRTTGDFAALGDCSVGTGRRAELLAASYQGAPAALLYRHAQDSAQIVDLFVCGSTTPIRTTTLPVP